MHIISFLVRMKKANCFSEVITYKCDYSGEQSQRLESPGSGKACIGAAMRADSSPVNMGSNPSGVGQRPTTRCHAEPVVPKGNGA